MARRRTKRVLKPRTPSRVRKKRAKTKKPRGHQHPELLGLALVAFGFFLASVLWAGWNGNRLRENFFNASCSPGMSFRLVCLVDLL